MNRSQACKLMCPSTCAYTYKGRNDLKIAGPYIHALSVSGLTDTYERPGLNLHSNISLIYIVLRVQLYRYLAKNIHSGLMVLYSHNVISLDPRPHFTQGSG